MDTISGNKLIAEFMGVKLGEEKYSYRPGVIVPLEEQHLAYHREWGWLMPVVEKIEDCKEFDDFGFSFSIDNWQATISKCLGGDIIAHVSTGKSKIEVVYSAILLFIHWYNTNKNS